jgi:opacity protein-like surface antigen
MKTPRLGLKSASLIAVLGLALSMAPLQAASNEKTAFSIGPAVAWLDSSAGDADLGGLSGDARFHLGELLVFDASLRGSYSYLTSTDSTDFERQNTDVDLVLSGSVLGFLVPYATVGASIDRFDAISYSGDSDWDAGYALGAGVDVTIIPALLSLTPAVRYVDADHTDTVTWLIDAQFHFSALAVGARADYEDNRSRDGDLLTVTAYASLRF